MDEKIIETSLETLIGRITDIKVSLQNFLLKLEHEPLAWPQVLDNYALLSGQINTLNKLLNNERMPVLRDLCILPILVSQDNDSELATFSENRIVQFNHEVVPDALRTKYEPDVEREEQQLTLTANSLGADEGQSQVSTLNDLISTVLDLVQSARDEWEVESAVEQSGLLPSANDSNILIAAITHGSGLKKRPESSGRSASSRSKAHQSGQSRTGSSR